MADPPTWLDSSARRLRKGSQRVLRCPIGLIGCSEAQLAAIPGGVGCGFRIVELQLQARIEGDPESGPVWFTRRAVQLSPALADYPLEE